MTQPPPTYTGPVPKSPQQVTGILEELRVLYPNAKYDLTFSTPLELFVATQLAAQCTDERVNAVTEQLFKKYHSAQEYATASQEELEQDIKPTGFYRNKAKTIRAACQYLVRYSQGEVPQTMAELLKLPGVARKTANVVLGNAFGISEGIIVDTHVDRLTHRFGWTNQKKIENIEQELMSFIPRQEWLSLAHRMIYHGRAVCHARKPLCAQCTVAKFCPSAFQCS